jgi:hypothetical protein
MNIVFDLGIEGHHFTSPESLRADLTRHDVLSIVRTDCRSV